MLHWQGEAQRTWPPDVSNNTRQKVQGPSHTELGSMINLSLDAWSKTDRVKCVETYQLIVMVYEIREPKKGKRIRDRIEGIGNANGRRSQAQPVERTLLEVKGQPHEEE